MLSNTKIIHIKTEEELVEYFGKPLTEDELNVNYIKMLTLGVETPRLWIKRQDD